MRIHWLIIWFRIAAIASGAEPAPIFLLEWGSQGDAPGEFHSPICIAVNSRDEVFVADLNNSRIQRFTTEGEFLSAFDLPNDEPPRKQCLIGGMSFDRNDRLYLSFMNKHHVGVYTSDGELLREWGRKGSGDGEFHQPGGVAVLTDGTVLVADQCNHRIQVFNSTGTYLRQWGGSGSEPGSFGGNDAAGSRFGGPHFLTVDSRGHVFTTEAALGRVQEFTLEGVPVAAWGSKSEEPGAFGEYVFGGLPYTVGPIGILADRSGRIWVSSLNDRVQGFTPSGRFLYQLHNQVGVTDDMFTHPHGMAVDGHGNLYIADSGNQRIVKFALPKSDNEVVNPPPQDEK